MHDAQLKRYKVAKNYKYICLNINVHIKLPVKYNFINSEPIGSKYAK